jgi:hypothetical protein
MGIMERGRKGEVYMSERDYLAKEEALRRLCEPEGDHELHAADPSKLEEWRRAPEGSQEEIWASHYDEAMGVLAMALE